MLHLFEQKYSKNSNIVKLIFYFNVGLFKKNKN